MTIALDKYIGTSEAGRHAGVSDETIRRWHRSGRLPGIETPYGLIFRPEDVATARRERNARPQLTEALGIES